MLVDANVLLYARDAESPFHERARTWLTERLDGPVRLALPWASLVAFLRISTNSRAYRRPLLPPEARRQVDLWLAAESSWVPLPTQRHAEVLGGLIERYNLQGDLVSDAHLAALAIEHGLTLCSADTDFARFSELRWLDPVAP